MIEIKTVYINLKYGILTSNEEKFINCKRYNILTEIIENEIDLENEIPLEQI